jgi:glycosyltransferase involved in cell wall biosynthesis
MTLKLLFVGKTDFQYNRDLILLNGLKKREDVSVEVLRIKKRNWATYKEIRKKSKAVDFVVIPSFRHKDVAYIKLASKAPVVFDPLISKYMTRVLDYQVKWKGPHKYLVDWLAFYWPDILIWDTKSHQKILVDKYRIKKPNTAIYIGVDTSLFFPIEKQKKDKVIVGFYGSFNPLQGIDKIVRAAHMLRDEPTIRFRIIGSGSTYKKVTALAEELKVTNIDFVHNVPYQKLNDAISEFDICLGVFGESVKADVVIPNKIYHYAAAKKCVITKNTEGVKELFVDGENICLVKNDPKAISEAVLALSRNLEKRDRLAEGAFEFIVEGFNEDRVADRFVGFLRKISNKN